jgi:peptidyl-prolyl cis-trans isomerase A (cyclophilin A)
MIDRIPSMRIDRVVVRLRAIGATLALALVAACDPAPPPQQASVAGGCPDAIPASATVPEQFRVCLETSKGPVVIELHRDWAPTGVDRFYQLVRNDFFNDARFFRVLPGFVAQFGVPADPQVSTVWADSTMQDDPVKQTNRRGTLTYAAGQAPNTRSTQLFINLADNANLDGMGFAPIGEVVEGMAAIDSLHSAYGEGPPYGPGPDQMRLMAEGNAYLQRQFPNLDYIRSVTIVR